MPKVFRHARMFESPFAHELFDARIESLHEQPGTRGAVDLVFNLKVFRQEAVADTIMIADQPYEVARGMYVPMRLRFQRRQWIWRTGPFEHFERLSPHHEARRLFGILHQRQPGIGEFYLAATETAEPGMLGWRAEKYELLPAQGETEQTEIVRRWAATPPNPARVVPHRPAKYFRYGGDPITVHLGKRTLKNRLFIGGLHQQRSVRPSVDAVLNLCGIENAWVAADGMYPDDRYAHKGEGILGMGVADLLAEASWVAERLRAGKRVLVHCFAGYNRSATVCCGALMLLEGMTAAQALDRVRESHPTAWPDPYHWFALRWIGTNHPHTVAPPHEQADEPEGAPLLREVGGVK